MYNFFAHTVYTHTHIYIYNLIGENEWEKLCILLVIVTSVCHDARFTECKVFPLRRVSKTQLDAQHILSIYRQPLHVSCVSRPIIRRYNRMYTTVGTCYYFQKAVCCPVWIGGWRNILRIICAPSWVFFTRLYRYAAWSTKHRTLH